MQRFITASILTAFLFGCGSTDDQAAEEPAPAAAPAATAPAPFVSVPELKELMGMKLEVDSNTILNAPYDENALKTDADWKNLDEAAGRMIEAAKSLMGPPLAKDQGKWMEESRKLVDLTEALRKTIQAKDKKALEEAGGKMLEESCTSCHKIYFP